MIYLNWQIDCYAAHRARIPALSHLRGAPFSLFSQNSSPLIEMQVRLVSGRTEKILRFRSPLRLLQSHPVNRSLVLSGAFSLPYMLKSSSRLYSSANVQNFSTLP